MSLTICVDWYGICMCGSQLNMGTPSRPCEADKKLWFTIFFLIITCFHLCYFIVLMSSGFIYISNLNKNLWMRRRVQTSDCHCTKTEAWARCYYFHFRSFHFNHVFQIHQFSSLGRHFFVAWTSVWQVELSHSVFHLFTYKYSSLIGLQQKKDVTCVNTLHVFPQLLH